ncbi:hypothetical protein CMUS01_04648 [Colletotrichum musicola]|uniref:Uncharacterized protein n=1 Tax=Colletotrichum musicola TaxID=2175873 RepID=A0A8H6KWA3_9PEZI|nr:hypothetical protein CMUS01_04648 [Colletotrichum musicola]
MSARAAHALITLPCVLPRLWPLPLLSLPHQPRDQDRECTEINIHFDDFLDDGPGTVAAESADQEARATNMSFAGMQDLQSVMQDAASAMSRIQPQPLTSPPMMAAGNRGTRSTAPVEMEKIARRSINTENLGTPPAAC